VATGRSVVWTLGRRGGPWVLRLREPGQQRVRLAAGMLDAAVGAQVPPAVLELVLREHPAVRDAAVVGRPHPGPARSRSATANAAPPGTRDGARTGPSAAQDPMATGRPAAAWRRALTVAQPRVGAAAAGE
jgi:acyl-CoA synthetase (AMP-forming)/AMP-acid ligase II